MDGPTPCIDLILCGVPVGERPSRSERLEFRTRAISHVLGVDRAEIRFQTGASGEKLFAWRHQIASMSPTSTLGMMGVAVGRGCRIGLDIERHRPHFVTSELVDRAFGIFARSQSAPAGDVWFFERWVCVESLLKATGLGLRLDPRRVRLGTPSHRWQPAQIDATGARNEQLWTRLVSVDRGLSCAMGSDRPVEFIRIWQMDGQNVSLRGDADHAFCPCPRSSYG